MMPQMRQQQNPQMVMRMRQQMISNPQQFAQNALRSGYFNGHEMQTNALNIVSSGNEKKAEEMVRNLCKEHNVSVEDTMQQFKQQYGIR